MSSISGAADRHHVPGRRGLAERDRPAVARLRRGNRVAERAAESGQGAAPWTGAILHASDGQRISLSGGRELTIKVDSQLTPGVRMSMVTEDLPPDAAIRVHLHEREDEIIFIRMGRGIVTLGDREVAVGPGATVYVPQGVWHGLRNAGEGTLGMSAIYSPPGFEQAFKDSLRPNRTAAEIEANRKKHGIVYRER
jgi:mannose-6-phosphate isomerase-like protein (cupin superfamily)